MIKISEQLIECLNRHSLPGQKAGDALREAVARASTADSAVIPVLGMQGMGKSTLINGLLKANILPNDADETTCVPVEVSYGEQEYGEVHFFDRPSTEKVYTREDLNKYVDNNENRGNAKKVERICLYRKAEILKGGVTIVDLPGVGSVTLENEKTTQRYIKNVCCAIFVIPVVPPIRKMEEIFIQGAWSQFSDAIFVENEWGETKTEIEDSMDFNTKLLRQTGEKIGSRFNGPILLVNAYDAVHGALNGNEREIAKSNIKTLEDKILKVASDWKSNLAKGIKDRIIGTIELSLKIARKKLDESLKSEAAQEAERKVQYEEFKAQNEKIFAQISEIESWLEDKEPKLKADIKWKISETVGDIRADLHRTINSGVYDGGKLEQTFAEVQSQRVQEYFDKVVEVFRNVAVEFNSKMNELQDALEVQNDLSWKTVDHESKYKTKWEDSLKVVGGAAGGILGLTYGGAVAALIFSNPAGWVVGAVGLVITGVVTLIASLFGKSVKEKRKREAKEGIETPLREIREKLETETLRKVQDFFSNAQTVLQKIKETQEDAEREMRRKWRRPVVAPDRGSLENDIRFLESAKQNIKS